LIWAIPPLSPQLPEFSNINPTHIPPLFTIPLPDDIVLHSELIKWTTISSWYLGSTHHLYFDLLCRHSKFHRFKLIVESDLSEASLHVINTSEPTPHNFDEVSFQSYRICDDTLVSCWTRVNDPYHPLPMHCRYGVYTGLTSARFANLISHGGPAAKMLLPDTGHDYCRLFSCPASGRFVLKVMDGNGSHHSLFILDFF
jgi:hypothetical protein